MHRHQIIPFVLVAMLSAGGGAAVGYAAGSVGSEPVAGAAGLPMHYQYLTSPPALQEVSPEVKIDSDGPMYMLGTDHGFVAVFYAEDQSLKERTRTPEAALSVEERERLASGIYIYTEEQLFRALQDYGS